MQVPEFEYLLILMQVAIFLFCFLRLKYIQPEDMLSKPSVLGNARHVMLIFSGFSGTQILNFIPGYY